MTKRKKLTHEVNGKTLLIDGDVLVYLIGFATEEEDNTEAILTMNKYIDELLHQSFCTDYRLFLSDSKGNFRKSIYPEYKGNRSQPKPKHYQMLRDYLVEYEKAEIAHGEEADDALGRNQTKDTMICTIDKDLNMIEGMHFHMKKRVHTEVSHKQARHSFWMQMLTGDTTDNIPGIKGIGPKKAEKILQGCTTNREYLVAVLTAYTDLTGVECIYEHLDMIGKLLYIRRKPNEMWSIYG